MQAVLCYCDCEALFKLLSTNVLLAVFAVTSFVITGVLMSKGWLSQTEVSVWEGDRSRGLKALHVCLGAHVFWKFYPVSSGVMESHKQLLCVPNRLTGWATQELACIKATGGWCILSLSLCLFASFYPSHWISHFQAASGLEYFFRQWSLEKMAF